MSGVGVGSVRPAALVDGEPATSIDVLDRGSAPARGYGARGDERPRRIVLRQAWPQERAEWRAEGVAVRIAALALGENPALAGLKHLNRLEQVLARMEEADSQALEALLFSSS